jgi:hypothetical protein
MMTAQGAEILALGSIARLRKLSSRSREEQHLFLQARHAASTVGAPLLSAYHTADFERRLEAAIHDPYLLAQSMMLAPDIQKVLKAQVFDGETLRSDFEDDVLVHASSPEVRHVLEQGYGYGLVMVEALSRASNFPALFAGVHELGKSDIAAVIVQDPEIPVEVARILLEGLRTAVCGWALIERALNAPVVVRPDVELAIAQKWTAGTWAMLRFYASVPELGVAVPESAVPPSERLDIASLAASAQRRERYLQEIGDTAAATGAEAYPDFDDDDDEDQHRP